MGEVMTLKEIETTYDKEWVLLENPVRTKAMKLKRAKVLWHSKDKHQVYSKISEFKPKYFAIQYFGARPEGVVYVL